MNYETLLKNIEARRRKLQKSPFTAGNEYLISLKKGNKRMSFHFHDSLDNKGKLHDWLMCLTLDYTQYCYTRTCSLNEFRLEFGYHPDYTSNAEVREIRATMKKNAQNYKKFFTKGEIKILEQEVSNY